jgi:hypothetical protein
VFSKLKLGFYKKLRCLAGQESLCDDGRTRMDRSISKACSTRVNDCAASNSFSTFNYWSKHNDYCFIHILRAHEVGLTNNDVTNMCRYRK